MQIPGASGALAWCQVNTVTGFITPRQAAGWEASVFCWGAQVLFCRGKSFKKGAASPCKDPSSSQDGMAGWPLEGRGTV